jgi:2-haloacid dehalogenase
MALAGIRASVFDAYGTLFDYGSAAAECRDTLGDKLEPLVSLWRDKQLQYTWLRAIEGRHADFWAVTGDALDYALAALGLAEPELRARLMNLYLRLAAFPEAPDTLKQLKARGLKTAILSNGTPQMLAAAVENAGIGAFLDAVFSVEEVQVYKPNAEVYRLAVERLGLPAEAIAFVSSNGWDAWAAADFGMRACWCNRRRQPPERLPGKLAAEITSLAELPALLGA